MQLVVCADDGREEQVQEVATLDKDCQRIEHLDLTLAEAKQLLATLQQHLVVQQAATFAAAHAQCNHCGATLQSQGHQMNLNPQAEHLLDWFHVAMRLTVMQQTAKSLPETTQDEEMTYEVRAPVTKALERLKWFLWHGNVYQALQATQTVEGCLEVAVATSSESTARKLLKAVEEFHTYITNHAGFIPNYGERYRHGERISTGFVESTVNQVVSKRMVKKQQMQWTKRGARWSIVSLKGSPRYLTLSLSTAMIMYQSMDMTYWLPETEGALAQLDA